MDASVVDGQSEAMMVNWLHMMLDRKENEHTEERDGLWKKAKHMISGSVCSDSFNDLGEKKWREC